MSDIEKLARELLAAEFRRQGYEDAAYAAENAIVGGYIGAVIGAVVAALSTAPQGVEPAAYQYREDAVRDGFASSDWEDISRDEYEARKAVMGGHGPKKIAGDTARGDLRLDPHGWSTELRMLYAAPQVPEDVMRDAERYRWLRQFEIDSYLAGGSMDRLDASIDESMLAAKRDEKA